MTLEAGYFIGIGSNKQPRANLPKVLDALARQFGCLYCSSIYLTEPVAMVDRGEPFRNAVAYLPTTWSPERLKAFTNDLETRLGRNRAHPRRKVIARPADVDLLYRYSGGKHPLTPASVTDEPYFLIAVPELLGYLGLCDSPTVSATAPTEMLSLAAQPVGQGPFTLIDEPSGLRIERGTRAARERIQ